LLCQTREEQGLTVTRLTDKQRAAFKEWVLPVQEKYRQILGDDIFDLILTYNSNLDGAEFENLFIPKTDEKRCKGMI
jgi:hypothetical protein